MKAIGGLLCVLTGFSSGAVVAGGIFAFIAIIGVIPRLAQRTGTLKFIRLYEDFVVLGGIFGCLTLFLDYYIPVGNALAAGIAACVGVFVGSLAVSLAEVMSVIPIFMRRMRLNTGLGIMITALALGKAVGSIIYFILPIFGK